MINRVANHLGISCDEADDAAKAAAANGWLLIEGGHSVYLIDEGRRLEAGKS